MSEEHEGEWMTLAEVMRALECGRIAVLTHAQKGDIHRRQTTAQRRYLRSSVEKLVESQRIPQAS